MRTNLGKHAQQGKHSLILGACSFLIFPSLLHGQLFHVDQVSDPAGYLSESEAIQQGTNHPSITPTLSSNGFRFGYWTVNDVRKAGADGRSLTQISSVINGTTTYKAYYFAESADTDGDGIKDWFEYRMWGDLSQAGGGDPDGDGFSNLRENELGQDPLIIDAVEDGGISGRLSTGFVYADTSMVLATIRSDPAGFVADSSYYVEMNSSVSTPSLHGENNGYQFAYWSVNGVRQAGLTGVAMSKVDLNVTAATNIIAHYLPSGQDSDGDGVKDWFELYQFGDLSQGPADDPDGDGFSNQRESALGQEATIVDLVEDGGISGRLSTGFVYADTSMVLATVKSDPAGFVPETKTYLETNGSLVTASLNGSSNGYNFAYWSVNGVRQAGPTGVSISKIDRNVTQTTTVIAHYLPSVQDSDGDGVKDWFELYQFGDLSQGPADDPDGDGFSNQRESELGQEAKIVDTVEDGGISGRLSTGVLYFQQLNRPPSALDLSNTIVYLNKEANQTVGTFSPTDPDDPNVMRTYGLGLIAGSGFTQNGLFNISGMDLRAAQTLTTEGNFSILVRVTDDENASFDKNFTIRAIHDPNKDDDNDGLTYSQELALGTSDNNPDSDGDGFSDGHEVANGSNPTDSTSQPGLNYGLVAWYPFDGNASDMSGNGRNAQLKNGLGSFVSGKIGQALDFDGVNDHAMVPSFQLGAPLSVSVWVKYRNLDESWTRIIDFGNDYKNNNIILNNHIGKTNQFNFSFWNPANSEDWASIDVPNMVYLNEWVHLVSSIDANGLFKVYGAGVLCGSLQSDFVPANISRSRQYIGKFRWSGPHFSGLMDDLRIYEREISPSEVQALYNLGGASIINPPVDLNSTSFLSILEESSIGTFIGEFNASDPDGDSITYHLVGEEGVNDNSLFDLNSTTGVLTNSVILDYETNATTYTITVQAKDEHYVTLEHNFSVSVTNVVEDLDGDGVEDHYDPDDDNDGFSDVEELAYGSDPLDENSWANTAPDFLELNGTSIIGNQPAGTEIGQFLVSDPDANASLSLVLFDFNVSDFYLDINHTLRAARVFDYETDDSNFTLSARVTDEHNFSLEKTFVVSLVDLPDTNDSNATDPYGHEDNASMHEPVDENNTVEYPIDENNSSEPVNPPHYDFDLNGTFISENQPVGTKVGEFISSSNQSHLMIFSLIDDNNSTSHNSFFTLSQDGVLRSAKMFDYENDRQVLLIDVRMDDQNNTSIEKTIEIRIIDQHRPIVRTGVALDISDQSAILSGKVLGQGREPVIHERGVLLSPFPEPVLGREETKRFIYEGNETGSFEILIEDLFPDQTYFFRVYAKNEEGVGYGSTVRFRTKSKLISPDWADAQPVTDMDGWWESSWMGTFYMPDNRGWIMHESLGWVFVLDQQEKGIWIWQQEIGWFWTNPEIFPYLFQNSSGNWLFLHGSAKKFALLFDFGTSKWIILLIE